MVGSRALRHGSQHFANPVPSVALGRGEFDAINETEDEGVIRHYRIGSWITECVELEGQCTIA